MRNWSFSCMRSLDVQLIPIRNIVGKICFSPLLLVVCGNQNFVSVLKKPNRSLFVKLYFTVTAVLYKTELCSVSSSRQRRQWQQSLPNLRSKLSTHLGRRSWLITDNQSIIMNSEQNFSELRRLNCRWLVDNVGLNGGPKTRRNS